MEGAEDSPASSLAVVTPDPFEEDSYAQGVVPMDGPLPQAPKQVTL
jgi:hypothetical protein